MREIRTIIRPVCQAVDFDADVNVLLSNGWALVKRSTICVDGEPSEAFHVPVVRALYAEMEREIPTFEEVTI